MSRPVVWGAVGAVSVVAIFFTGFFAGVVVAFDNQRPYIESLQVNKDSASAQMQCINWVNQWRYQPNLANGDNPAPTFGMFVELCGKPEAHQAQ